MPPTEIEQFSDKLLKIENVECPSNGLMDNRLWYVFHNKMNTNYEEKRKTVNKSTAQMRLQSIIGANDLCLKITYLFDFIYSTSKKTSQVSGRQTRLAEWGDDGINTSEIYFE